MCQTCQGLEWVVAVRETATQRARWRPCLCYWLSRLPPSFRGARFGSWRAGQRTARPLAARLDGGAYLWGPYGTGKTHLLACQFAALAERGRTSLIWTAEATAVREWQEEVRDRECRARLGLGWLRGVDPAEPWHLFLDDLGRSKATDFAQARIYELVNLVYERAPRWSLSATSNYDLTTLGRPERLGGAVARRLEALCHGRIVELRP